MFASVTVFALLFVSETATTQCLNNSQNARLSIKCLLDVENNKMLSVDAAKVVDQILKREGYSKGLGLPGSIPNPNHQTFMLPNLEYSADVNGGNPDKPLVLGNLIFIGDKNLVRKEGFLLGARFGVNGRYIHGEGRYFNFSVGAAVSRSHEHKMNVVQLSTNVCSKQHIKNWWYVDLCGNTRNIDKQLTEESTSNFSLTTSKIFSLNARSHHQAAVEIRRHVADQYEQNQLAFGIQTIHENGVFTKLDYSVGEEIENQLALRRSITGSVGTRIAGRKVTVSVNQSVEDGGLLLGVGYKERNASINMTYQSKANWIVNLGYLRTESNVDYFSSREPIFNISFTF